MRLLEAASKELSPNECIALVHTSCSCTLRCARARILTLAFISLDSHNKSAIQAERCMCDGLRVYSWVSPPQNLSLSREANLLFPTVCSTVQRRPASLSSAGGALCYHRPSQAQPDICRLSANPFRVLSCNSFCSTPVPLPRCLFVRLFTRLIWTCGTSNFVVVGLLSAPTLLRPATSGNLELCLRETIEQPDVPEVALQPPILKKQRPQ